MKTISLWIIVILVAIPLLPNGFIFPKDVAFFGGIGLLTIFFKPKFSIKKKWILPFVLLIVSIFLSFSNIRNQGQFELQLLTIFGGIFFFFFAQAEFGSTEQLKVNFYKALVLIGIFEVALSVCEMVAIHGLRVTNLSTKMSFVGSFGNPEYLAFFLGAGFLVTLHQKDIFMKTWVRILSQGILLLGLFLSESRLTWLSLAASFAIYYLQGRHWIKSIYLIVGSMAAFSFFAIIKNSLLGIHTLQGRLLIWKSAISIADQSSWVGVGLGQFRNYFFDSMKAIIASGNKVFIDNSAFSERAHNEYFDALAEGGIFLLFSLCLILGYFLTISLKNIRRGEKNSESHFWIFMTIVCFFSFPLHILPNLLTVIIFMALLLPAKDLREEFDFKQLRFLKPLFAVSFVALALKISLTSFCSWRTTKEIKNGDTTEAMEWAKTGLQWDSDNYDLLLTSARLQYVKFDLIKAFDSVDKMYSTAKTVDVLKLRGLVFLSLKNFENAKMNYLELETAYPKMVTPKYYLGRIYSQQGHKDIATNYFSMIQTLPALNEKATFDRNFSRVFIVR